MDGSLRFIGIDDASVRLDAELDPPMLLGDHSTEEERRGIELIAGSPWPWSREVYALVIERLMRAGARAVRIVCIVAAPEGIALVEKSHPDVEIYTPVVDRELNAQKYILPGLGDFGDRLYGTC